jgi:hypothetical protein
MDMVVYTCNPSTQQTEAEGSQFQGQHELHSKTLSQRTKGWGSSVVEYLPNMNKTQGPTPSPPQTKSFDELFY